MARTSKARSTSAASPSSRPRIWTRPSSGQRNTHRRRGCRPKCGRSDDVSMTLSTVDVEEVFRREYGRAVAVLTRAFGDIDLAEEAVQEAFAAAVERWPSSGLPPSPAGWIITTARNKTIDRLRRESTRDERHAHAALLTVRDELEEDPV